jgi:hypothetical protein
MHERVARLGPRHTTVHCAVAADLVFWSGEWVVHSHSADEWGSRAPRWFISTRLLASAESKMLLLGTKLGDGFGRLRVNFEILHYYQLSVVWYCHAGLSVRCLSELNDWQCYANATVLPCHPPLLNIQGSSRRWESLVSDVSCSVCT